MNIIVINKRLGLQGQNLIFEKVDLFDLKPDTIVNQIGNGKENGCIRTDVFIEPVLYVGSIECQFVEIETMYAFKLNQKSNDNELFFLYGKTPFEIFTEHKDYVRWYKPVFK
jgi:hypothetical protein